MSTKTAERLIDRYLTEVIEPFDPKSQDEEAMWKAIDKVGDALLLLKVTLGAKLGRKLHPALSKEFYRMVDSIEKSHKSATSLWVQHYRKGDIWRLKSV